MNYPSSFSKTKGFHSSGPTCFFLFLSAALELFLNLTSEIYTGVREVTHIPVHSPAHFPAGILPGFLGFLFGRDLATVLLQCLLAGIHLVIMLLLSPVSHSFSPSIS